MNTKSLVRPIRSLQRFSLTDSGIQPGPIQRAELLKEILRPGEGRSQRCATNVVVYGGQTPVANEFAKAALACLLPLDSLWRVGAGEDLDSRVIWIAADDELVSMLSARVVFIPDDAQASGLLFDWQHRADAIFVGGEGPAEFDRTLVAAFPGNVWQWQSEMMLVPSSDSTSLPLGFVPSQSMPVTIAFALTEAAVGVGMIGNVFRFECLSQDQRVRATVEGNPGGVLKVVFVATDPQLKGATVRLHFRTTVGSELKGELQLWEDEADRTQFVAFWQGNQLDLNLPGSAPNMPSESPKLVFQFEVLPVEPPGQAQP